MMYFGLDIEQTGLKIKWYRMKKGLRQKDVADALGISLQGVSRWERGLNLPSLDNAVMMADLFGTDVESFVVMNEGEGYDQQ